MTGITHKQNTKDTLNSINSFAICVECAKTYNYTELQLNGNEGEGVKKRVIDAG